MFDAYLQRQIKDGKEFNGLFPASLQTKTKLGTGDTSLTIDLMVKMIKNTLNQTKKVAKKLEKSSLNDTINAIHQFLYWHFQYKADGTAQMLHAPSRSWENRYKGIDCKSYTILASSILTNLGIDHVIRKIKQPAFNPTQFTHVYVYIPKANKIIDGTIPDNIEPIFVEKKDFNMSLPHFGLNGAINKQSYWIDNKGRIRNFANGNSGLKQPYSGFYINPKGEKVYFISHQPQGLNGLQEWIGNLLKSNFVQKVLGWFKCIGGSAITSNDMVQKMNGTIKHYEKIVSDLNNAVSQNNLEQVKHNINLFARYTKSANEGYRAALKTSWNSCTTKSLNGLVTFSAKINDFYPTFEKWVKTYYDAPSVNTTENTSEAGKFFNLFYGNHAGNMPTTNYSYPLTIKVSNRPNILKIPFFELSDPVFTAVENKQTPDEILQFLQQTAITFIPPQNSGAGTYTAEPNNPINPQPNTKTLGATGWLIGGALLGSAYLFLKSKNNPNPQKNVSRTRK